MLNPRERINSLRNFFPGKQNGVEQMMRICILVGLAEEKGDGK